MQPTRGAPGRGGGGSTGKALLGRQNGLFRKCPDQTVKAQRTRQHVEAFVAEHVQRHRGEERQSTESRGWGEGWSGSVAKERAGAAGGSQVKQGPACPVSRV